MSKRMQVLFEDREYRQIQRVARRSGMTLAEWVRQVLRTACREEPRQDTDRKLSVVREAVTHGYPTADVEDMLADIESGYRGGDGE